MCFLLQIERTIAYQENAMELSKWAPTVLKNRKVSKINGTPTSNHAET